MAQPFTSIRFFRDVCLEDIPLVGGKNASLGEMYRALTPQGVPVPDGFVVTAEAYRYVLESAGAWGTLHAALDGLDVNNVQELARRGKQARDIVYGAGLPAELQQEIRTAYQQLQAEYGSEMTVAVRSSATAEDLPTASFAGQHDTSLHITGEAVLLDACPRCCASLCTNRAIHYRSVQGFDHFKVFLSVGIMKMVRSDLAASGGIFTLDTESGCRDVVFMTGAYGLGENVVQGTVDPDEFYVHKPTFTQGYRAVLRRARGEKKIKMVDAEGGTREATRNIPTASADREHCCISDAEVLTLAEYAMQVEAHYSMQAGRDLPMDMEWAKDGLEGKLYMIQARPETVASQKTGQVLEEYTWQETGPVVVTGRAVGTKIATGTARVISSVAQLSTFKEGEILIAETTTPDWGTVMQKAAAIVTHRGGWTCHAAIVARELGVPAVVGAAGATERIQSGSVVTIACAEGEVGKVYAGVLPFTVQHIDLRQLQRPVTKILVNIGNPALALQLSGLPNDGVGLARMECIISAYIKAHPMALLHPERVTDPTERAELAALTRQYATPADFCIEKLSEGIGTIAAAFYPRPVVVRMSDFKTNEYASLLGGKAFEPVEANPMLGFRGAARYAHPAYAEGFALECAALRRVREIMRLTNVKIMMPFCRRVEEGEKVLQAMAEHGVQRGVNGLEISVMCEIPNNVLQIDAFAQLCDGCSIGSNDLTQLTLGGDRDSALVAFAFDERDPGVLAFIRQTIAGARRNHRHGGICGQAPSDYPEVAEYLVQLGIDSISLNPDSVLKTTVRVLQLEETLGRQSGRLLNTGTKASQQS